MMRSPAASLAASITRPLVQRVPTNRSGSGKGGKGVRKKGNFLGLTLFILGVIIAAGLWGPGIQERGLHAQTVSEPPTNTGEELKKALLDGKPVLVDFGSNKCIPCRQLRPVLKDVAQEFSGKAQVLIIDVFQHQNVAREHRIQLIPTLVFFNAQGKEVFRRSGVWDKESIIRKLNEAGAI
jgi:thioredoxin 1